MSIDKIYWTVKFAVENQLAKKWTMHTDIDRSIYTRNTRHTHTHNKRMRVYAKTWWRKWYYVVNSVEIRDVYTYKYDQIDWSKVITSDYQFVGSQKYNLQFLCRRTIINLRIADISVFDCLRLLPHTIVNMKIAVNILLLLLVRFGLMNWFIDIPEIVHGVCKSVFWVLSFVSHVFINTRFDSFFFHY